MPINKSLYPLDWTQISLAVRKAANWTCQNCGKPCRKPGQSWDEFRAYLLHDVGSPWFEQAAEELPTGGFKDYPTRFVLTVAHLDGNPSNCELSNLRALCAPCHLQFDTEQHVRSRKHSRYKSRERSGQLSLGLDL